MSKRLAIKIPSDGIVLSIICTMAIINFLPILYVAPRLIWSMVELMLTGVLFLIILQTDRKMFYFDVVIFGIAILVNLLAYYHCWINTLSIGSYMIRSCMCWVYMMTGVFVYRHGSEETKKYFFYFIIFLLLLTSLTSIIVARDYPTAMRSLENGSVDIKGMEKMLFRRNTATWPIVYAMSFALPYLIFAFKKTRNVSFLAISAIICFCILKSQITMALLFAVAFLVLLIIKPIRPQIIVVSILIIALLSWMCSEHLADGIYWIYINAFGGNTNTMLGKRFFQLWVSIDGLQLVGTYGGRLDLYRTSINTFFAHPFLGVNTHASGTVDYSNLIHIIGLHSQIFDLLATTGLLCTGALGYAFYLLVKNNKGVESRGEYTYLFYYVIIMLIAFMVLNPTYYSACVYLIVFAGPAFLSTLKEQEPAFKIVKAKRIKLI